MNDAARPLRGPGHHASKRDHNPPAAISLENPPAQGLPPDVRRLAVAALWLLGNDGPTIASHLGESPAQIAVDAKFLKIELEWPRFPWQENRRARLLAALEREAEPGQVWRWGVPADIACQYDSRFSLLHDLAALGRRTEYNHVWAQIKADYPRYQRVPEWKRRLDQQVTVSRRSQKKRNSHAA